MRTAPQSPAERRKQLLHAGYVPTPVRGKAPFLEEWQKKIETNPDEIDLWSELFPDAKGTGLLTRLTPAFDLDILDEEAAEACEALVRERFEERGYVLVRIGLPPKRAVLFRTNEPFKKITANLIAPNPDPKLQQQKIEMLADGQQLAAFGIHPDTGRAYRWHGGEPGEIKRDDLPYISAEEAQQLVEDVADLLCREHGYQRAKGRPKKERKANGKDADAGGSADWGYLVENIRAGRALHDSLRDLAGKLVKSGMGSGAAINFLRGLMDEAPEGERDKRWQARRAHIPRLVESAQGPQETSAAPNEATTEIQLEDFVSYLPMHNYIFIPTREIWPGRSVNTRLPPVLLTDKTGKAILNTEGKEQYIAASEWLDKNRAVEQMTWTPGDSMLIRDKLVSDGGWIKRDGVTWL
jgi:Bifunctional DNA primase/polymerase, N-terminal